jgi:hypothetical protein
MMTSTGPAEPLTAAHVLQAAFPALRQPAAALTTCERTVHVIPNGAEPRWIILGNPAEALPVLRSWRPWNLTSRVQWSAVLFAASVKMLPRLPRVCNSTAGIDTTYWQGNLPEFSARGATVIHVGNPSHTRKAILFFLGEDHSINAVAKVPLARQAAQAILNEAAILQRIKRIVRLPRILFQDSDRGVAAQSWLDGKPVSRGFSSAHLDLLSLLANPGSNTRVSDYRAEVAAQLDQHDLPFDRTVLAHALELLNFDEPLQGFVEHRDFAPWNLKRFPDGSLGLLDWEWAVSHSLPWQDICRFFYNQDALFKGHGRVWEVLTGNRLLQRYRKRFAIPEQALPALTMHYLLRVLSMDWQSGNTRVAQCTFEQIQRLLGSYR